MVVVYGREETSLLGWVAWFDGGSIPAAVVRLEKASRMVGVVAWFEAATLLG